MNEHVLDDLEAYALGALDAARAEHVAAHVAHCASCREQVMALDQVVARLPETVPTREPRSSLRERVLAAARHDTVAATSAPTGRSATWSIRPARIALAGLVGAMLVLGAADIDAYRRLSSATTERNELYAMVSEIRQGGRWWYMPGKEEFAGSGGTLIDPRAGGYAPFVLFHDLPSIPAGKVLTVWLISPDSTWARAATFRPNGRDIQQVTITMEVAGFERCAVTVEDSGWGQRSGRVVMESRIVPPTAPPSQ